MLLEMFIRAKKVAPKARDAGGRSMVTGEVNGCSGCSDFCTRERRRCQSVTMKHVVTGDWLRVHRIGPFWAVEYMGVMKITRTSSLETDVKESIYAWAPLDCSARCICL